MIDGGVDPISWTASIEFWEDDDGGENCDYNGGADGAQELVNDLTNAYHVVSQVIAIASAPYPPISMGIGLALSIRHVINSGSDILLGRAINVQLPNGSFSQNQYRLIRTYYADGIRMGLQDNGSMNLTIVQP